MIEDAGYSVQNSYEVLRQATNELKAVIESKFDEAKTKSDLATMERFFKLFPLINEHQIGLKRFGAYLSVKITEIGEQNYRIMQVGFSYHSTVNNYLLSRLVERTIIGGMSFLLTH